MNDAVTADVIVRPAFDLADYDVHTNAERGMPMPLMHPRSLTPLVNADGTKVTITMLGRASDTYRDLQRVINEENVLRQSQGVRTTLDDVTAENTRMLLVCCKAWNLDRLDGRPFPYSEENARRLFTDPRFIWVRDAALMFMRNDGNFLPTASRGS